MLCYDNYCLSKFTFATLYALFLVHLAGRYSTVRKAVNKRIRHMTRAQDSDSLPSTSASSSSLRDDANSVVMHGTESVSGGAVSLEESVPGQCALKLISKEDFWQQVQTNLERKDTLVREVLAQSFLVHSIMSCGPADGYDELSVHGMELPIVQINGVFETRSVDECISTTQCLCCRGAIEERRVLLTPPSPSPSVCVPRSTFVIDMELMQPTDLFQKLCEHGRGFKEYQVKHIAIQLVQAVAMLEACSISHRDIKLSNVTFPVRLNEELAVSGQQSKSKHKPMQIKLADFGMAGFVEKDGFLRGRCGTPGYVAPGTCSMQCAVHCQVFLCALHLMVYIVMGYAGLCCVGLY